MSSSFNLGMGGCLAASNNAAKSLAAALGKPIVGVHHMVELCSAFILQPLILSLASACTHPSFNFRSSSTVSFPNTFSIRRAHAGSICEVTSFLQTTFNDGRPRYGKCLRSMFKVPQSTTRPKFRPRSRAGTLLSYQIEDTTPSTDPKICIPPFNLPTFIQR